MNIVQGPSLQAVESLLRANDLPFSDLSELSSSDFLFCGDAEEPIGIIGLEVVDSAGLLRSLVVAQSGRKQGCATALVAALESKAKQAGTLDLYLLTETAELFFAKLGYEVIPREHAPLAIRSTREFSGLCPDDATLMHKQLGITSLSE